MPRNTWASGEMWLANARPPRPWDGRDRILLSGNQSAFNFRKVACRWTAVGRPGPTIQPMAWVGTRATPKQPAFSGCFGQAVRRMGGPSVGHGYRNAKSQPVVTVLAATWSDPSRTGSVLRPSGPEIRNCNHGPWVLPGKPSHNRRGRTTDGQSMMEEARSLSLGVSIFLLVVGAILTFAVDVSASGFSINTVGIILMIAGALGLVLSLLFWSSFSPYRRSRTVAGPDTVVEERRIERDLP
jgi:hypothetical protein